jgi:hypothetical protein
LKSDAFAALVLSLTGIGAAQQAPVPMDEEPHHHVLPYRCEAEERAI